MSTIILNNANKLAHTIYTDVWYIILHTWLDSCSWEIVYHISFQLRRLQTNYLQLTWLLAWNIRQVAQNIVDFFNQSSFEYNYWRDIFLTFVSLAKINSTIVCKFCLSGVDWNILIRLLFTCDISTIKIRKILYDST